MHGFFEPTYLSREGVHEISKSMKTQKTPRYFNCTQKKKSNMAVLANEICKFGQSWWSVFSHYFIIPSF